MKNRGCYVLFLLLTLAANAKTVSAQTSALQVQVYDYTGLSPAAFHEFVACTQDILARSGVSLEVDACAGGAAACESHSGTSRQIVIRVIADTRKSMKNVRLEKLGMSVAGHDGGFDGVNLRRHAFHPCGVGGFILCADDRRTKSKKNEDSRHATYHISTGKRRRSPLWNARMRRYNCVECPGASPPKLLRSTPNTRVSS